MTFELFLVEIVIIVQEHVVGLNFVAKELNHIEYDEISYEN